MQVYLGVDVGSVTTKAAAIDQQGEVVASVYLRTRGQPIEAVQEALSAIRGDLGKMTVAGAGATGSARRLAAAVVGADVVKNEITAHAVAASAQVPGVQTVLEIGGQDSKIIILRQAVVVDFAMNTVCAAGTGSFLDQQAARLSLSLEEFSEMALKARSPVRIAGRCAVFAESDMIHKQQAGHSLPDIVAGLCEALVRNFLNNVGKGKEIRPDVVFQGGVAANQGMRRAFSRALECEIVVPEHHHVMGAIGAAILAREAVVGRKTPSTFKGFSLIEMRFSTENISCAKCANQCEVVELKNERQILARWGDRCGRWQQFATDQPSRFVARQPLANLVELT